MPREPRLLLSKSYYHIMTRGNNKNVIFPEKEDYFHYLKRYQKFKLELPFDLYHYCLMPTHVHQLIRTQHATNFSQFMKKINLAYFHYFRQKYGWVGHFWQGRFKSQPVGKDAYFIQCGKYIELNPVRKGLVQTPSDYMFSSYNYYVFGKKNHLVTKDMFFLDMGKNESERTQKYINLIISKSIKESYKKQVWGQNYQRYHETRKKNYNLDQKRSV